MVSDQQSYFLETCTQSTKHSVQHSNKHPNRQAQEAIVQEVSQKGRRKTSESSFSFSPKSNEETGRDVQNQCFQNSEDSPKMCNSLRYVYSRETAEEEEWAMWHFNQPYSHTLVSNSVATLNSNSLQSRWKPAAWQLPEGAERGWDSLQSLIPRELSGSFLEDPICMAVCIWTDSELAQFQLPLPRGHLSKTFRGNCWTLQLPEAVDNTRGQTIAEPKP